MEQHLRREVNQSGEVCGPEITNCHAKELLALTAVVNSVNNRRNIAQNIPIHMRRRQASHNPKRLPKQIRDKLKKGIFPKKNKPPSREYRRRRKFREGNSRTKTGWLETHIWHAKRFHMVEKWGIKLASLPTMKGMTAVLKAAQQNCLISDESYVKCVEISGVQLKDIFPQLFPCEYNLLFGDEVYIGCKETRSLLYDPEMKFPRGIIAPVSIMCSSPQSALMWCHTSAFEEVLELFSRLKDTHNVTYIDLSGELVRFLLRGPESSAMINKTTYLLEKRNADSALEMVSTNTNWTGVSCPTVRDPRLCMMEIVRKRRVEKEKVETEPEDGTNMGEMELMLSNQKYPFHQSELLKKESRKNSTNSRKPAESFEQNKKLIPGSTLPVQKDEKGIPVIISERPDLQEFAFIVPKGWGRDFWQAFQYGGARPAGLTEVGWTTTDRDTLRFPDEYPDTKSGREDERVLALQSMEHFSRRPPNNRSNYDRLIINSPFRYEWSAVVGKESVTVLRSKSLAQELSTLLSHGSVDTVKFEEYDLVTTRIGMLNRGVPECLAHICIPTKDDISTYFNSQAEDLSQEHGVTEPQPKEKQSMERDEFYTVTSKGCLKPSRELIGYVKSGFYSRTDGRAKGHALISMKHFLSLAKEEHYIKLNSKGENSLLILMRNIDSLQYRYALLQVETNI